MKINCLLIFCFTFLAVSNIIAQSSYDPPKIIPPSPEAQNFMRYGEIPVDYSTGVPNISVPIWQLKSRKLELPISISYHASGIKVNDRSSDVGLGWVLNSGGIVTRTVLGQPDECYPKPNYRTANSYDSVRTVVNGQNLVARRAFGYDFLIERDFKDWESDRFTFQLPTGESGVFRYDFVTDSLILIPYQPIKVEKSIYYHPYNQLYNYITSIKITSSNGTIFIFDIPENGSSWLLSKMISVDKTDTVRFVYQAGENRHMNHTYSSYIDYGVSPVDGPGPTWTFQGDYYGSGIVYNTPVYTDSKVLDSIISATTIIKCTNTSDREDMSLGVGKYRLTKMSFYDRLTNVLIKEVSFSQSYFGTSGEKNQRMRLDSLSFKDRNSVKVETYKFKYESAIPIPYVYLVTGTDYPFAEDFWGYYNGRYSYSLVHHEYVPDNPIYLPGIPSSFYLPSYLVGDRSPDTAAAKAALIKEIVYPTGGKSIFNFESHPSGGGFRIRQITNYTDSLIVANTKTYSYGEAHTLLPETGLYAYDVRSFYRLQNWYSMGTNCTIRREATTRYIFSSSSFLPLQCPNGPTVMYTDVTEYNDNGSGENGKIVYAYQQPPDIPTITTNIRFHSPFEMDRGNYTPKLLGKAVYKKQGGSYVLVKTQSNTYEPYLTTEYPMGIHLVQTSTYPGGQELSDYTDPAYADCSVFTTLEFHNYFNYGDMKAVKEQQLLAKTRNYEYDANGNQTLVDSMTYTYANLTHLQPTEQRSIDSKGDTLKTKFKYPVDSSGIAVYDTMLVRNIVTPVIEQSSYKNSTFLQSVNTRYYDWGNNIIAPKTVASKTLTNSVEARLRFHAYDTKGNVLSVSKENDSKISYVWDYNNTYPVAQVTNADTGSIAYTSFEADGKGKWSYSGTAIPERYPPTGKLVYNLNGSNNITRSGLSSGTTYVISYWTKNGSAYSITGTISGYPILGRTLNGWKYFEHRITGQTSITISGTGTIDELRLYPLSAQMVTYTYYPSTGIESQCDANNRIAYYYYDNFNRLSLVLDQDRKVLKKICYNYAGQSENCNGGYFLNTQVSQDYTRDNCGSGYIGSTVTYTVPAGSYVSTISQTAANQLAYNEIYANGQQYANTNGTCTEVVGISYTNSVSSCYIVEFYNTSTYALYYFQIPTGTGALGYIPPGTYDVTIYDSGGCDWGNYRTYNACYNYTSNSNGTALITGVTISPSCNQIGIQ